MIPCKAMISKTLTVKIFGFCFKFVSTWKWRYDMQCIAMMLLNMIWNEIWCRIMVLYDVLCLPHSGNVMTEPKVPPRYEKETNVPFSDSGDHLNWDFSVKRGEWKWFKSVKKSSYPTCLWVGWGSGNKVQVRGPVPTLDKMMVVIKALACCCRGSCCCCVYDDALPESINNWEADVRLKLSTDDRYEGWENCAEEPESYCDTHYHC